MAGSTVSSSNTALCVKLYKESAKVGEWRKEQLLKITKGYEPKNIYNAHETGLYISLPPNKTLSVKGNPCNGK
jgi:hypothetical protein